MSWTMNRNREFTGFLGKNISAGKISTAPNVSGKNCNDLEGIPEGTGITAGGNMLGISPREYASLQQACTGAGLGKDWKEINDRRRLDLETEKIISSFFDYIQSLPQSDPIKQRLGYKNSSLQPVGVILGTYIEAAKMAYKTGWNGSKKGASLERVLLDKYQISINYNSFI